MKCVVCEFLKDVVKLAYDQNYESSCCEELRRLAYNHYRRFHPNPFDQAMAEFQFSNEKY